MVKGSGLGCGQRVWLEGMAWAWSKGNGWGRCLAQFGGGLAQLGGMALRAVGGVAKGRGLGAWLGGVRLGGVA